MEDENKDDKDNKDMNDIYLFKESEQYVNLLQENLTRMANNSANCKNWLMGIIGGSLALCISNNTSSEQIDIVIYVLIAISIMFYFLDGFYLGLERRFKDAEKLFVERSKAKDENDVRLLLMSFSQTLKIKERKPDVCSEFLENKIVQLKAALKGMTSISTICFYMPIIILLIILTYYL